MRPWESWSLKYKLWRTLIPKRNISSQKDMSWALETSGAFKNVWILILFGWLIYWHSVCPQTKKNQILHRFKCPKHKEPHNVNSLSEPLLAHKIHKAQKDRNWTSKRVPKKLYQNLQIFNFLSFWNLINTKDELFRLLGRKVRLSAQCPSAHGSQVPRQPSAQGSQSLPKDPPSQTVFCFDFIIGQVMLGQVHLPTIVFLPLLLRCWAEG